MILLIDNTFVWNMWGAIASCGEFLKTSYILQGFLYVWQMSIMKNIIDITFNIVSIL
jgi:hypothetical protein